MSYALISTHDKSELEELAKALDHYGYNILSTGGTANHLRNMGILVTDISTYTNSPEILDGRVKTLHPKVCAGILARRNLETDLKDLEAIVAQPIDIVVVNLYPFKEKTSDPTCTLPEAIEEIDIGGVSLIRAGAKNFNHVTVLTNPNQYKEFTDRLRIGKFDLDYRKSLAIKAFQVTSDYDTFIASYLDNENRDQKITVPKTLYTNLIQPLRYGENPHQKAGLYSLGINEWPIIMLHGKKLSYNNILDADAALTTLLDFDNPCAVIVKHLTPCGVALASNLKQAFLSAFESDPVSAYGGIIALNGIVDYETAEEISKLFAEVIIAQGYNLKAFELLSKKKNLRLLEYNNVNDRPLFSVRSTIFGSLFQDLDLAIVKDFKVMGTIPVNESDLKELTFASTVAKHVKSNSIVVSKGFKTVGIGAGQPNRVGSSRIALSQAGEKAQGAYLASDGFFPFTDSIELAATYGIKAVIEPGGSINDDKVIDSANKMGIALVFTAIRHFLH